MKKELLQFTENEKSIVMGTMLGDGHIQKREGSYRLKIEHSQKEEEYVLWKHKKLSRLCLTTHAPKKVTSKKGDISVLFYTSSGTYLQPIYDLYYKLQENGRYLKIFTSSLISALPMNPLVLATWFLDDGSVRNDCYGGKIASQGFTLEENHLLKEYLAKWGIKANVVKHTKKSNQYYLSIPASSFGTLADLIQPIVEEIPTMVYKLNLSRKPRND